VTPRGRRSRFEYRHASMGAMRRRLPWVIALPLAFAGSWVAHLVGRALVPGAIEGSEAAEHLERATVTHGGPPTLAVAAVVAPFVAVALVVFAARSWTEVRGRSLRGAGAIWFLILPAVAYVSGELLERLTSGGSEAPSLHAIREPALLLALALQIPFGVVAYAIARLLLAAALGIVARVRRAVPETRRPQRADFEPKTWIPPARWSCLVGARGLRGPPVVLPS
jgi:hypothetical protein